MLRTNKKSSIDTEFMSSYFGQGHIILASDKQSLYDKTIFFIDFYQFFFTSLQLHILCWLIADEYSDHFYIR